LSLGSEACRCRPGISPVAVVDHSQTVLSAHFPSLHLTQDQTSMLVDMNADDHSSVSDEELKQHDGKLIEQVCHAGTAA
jgi:hypothetical protein